MIRARQEFPGRPDQGKDSGFRSRTPSPTRRLLVLGTVVVVVAAAVPFVPATSHSPVATLPSTRLASGPIIPAAVNLSSSSFPVREPSSIAAGDLRRNGKQDVVTGGQTISVALGNGDGTFQPAVQYPYAVSNLKLADVNGDGILDIVATTGNVIVLLGNGDGTFQAPITSTATGGASSLAVGDVNGDGKADVVVADESNHEIGVMLGLGNGQFQAPTTYPTHGGPGDVKLADLAGSGRLDTVVADGPPPGADPATVGVFRNQGNGVFATEVTYRIGNTYADAHSVAIADVNGDGVPDLVVGNRSCGYNNGDTVVLLGTGGGTFGTAISLGDTCTNSVTTADINGDHVADVISSNPTGFYNPTDQVRVMLADGGGTFQPPAPFTITTGSAHPNPIVAADFNGDGIPDIAVANYDNCSSCNPTASFTVLINNSPRAPIGGAPTAASTRGNCGCSTAVFSARPRRAEPIDPESGNFSESYTDFNVPGRGRPLSFVRTYNSNASTVDGPLGFGWTFNGAMSLAVDPTSQAATITEEDGAQTVFNLVNGTYTPLPRVIGALTKNGDGTFAFVRQKRETITFSATGQELSDTDLNGYATTFGYDVSGRLATVTDASSRKLTLSYAGTHISQVSDPTGRIVQFGYNDAAGNLTDVTDVGGQPWKFGYKSGTHLLATLTDPRIKTVTNDYDTATPPRVDWQTDSLQRKTTFTYSGTATTAAGGTTQIQDPKGNLELIGYQYGLRVGDTRGYGTPQAATWNYTYDPATLQVTSVNDPNGHVTSATYDQDAELLTTTDALGRTTKRSYYVPLHELLTVTDPLTIQTTYTYDAHGNLHTQSRPDTTDGTTATVTFNHDDGAHAGDVTSMLDAVQKRWLYTYDQYGIGLTATDPPTAANPAGDMTITCHDNRGWPTWTVAPRGSGGLTPATVCANAITQESQLTQTPPAYTSVTNHVNPTTGLLNLYGDWQSMVDANQHTTKRSYDPDRNVLTSTDALGNVTCFVYDDANERLQETRGCGSPQQSTLTTDYWPDGTVHHQIDGANASTQYDYDGLARVTRVTDPLGRATAYAYDGAGNKLSEQLPTGDCSATPKVSCRQFTYDVANELKGITYSDATTGDVTSVTYDADGQRTAMSDKSGTSGWTYDSLHRLRSSTDGAGATVSYAYDLHGRLLTLGYPGGLTVTRVYDDAGRLISVKDSQTTKAITFTPDFDSNVTNIQYPNSTSSTMAFDRADVLTSVTHTLPQGPVSFGYGRDSLNQVSSVTTSGIPNDSHGYAYTPLNQLNKVDAGTYQYDLADNVTGLPDPATGFSGSPVQQRYDAANEVVSRVELVGATQQSPSLGKSVQVRLPAGVQAGDEILIATTQVSKSTASTPSGYTAEPSSTSSGTPSTTTQLFVKRATGGESSATLSYSPPAQPAIVVAVYRGVDTTLLDAPVQTGSTSMGNSVSVAGFATATTGDELVMIGGATNNLQGQTWTAPAGMTTETQTPTQTLATSGIFDETLGAPGTVGSQTATVNGVAKPMTGILLALKPATIPYDLRGDRTATPTGGTSTTLTYDLANRLVGYGATVTYSYNGDGLRVGKKVGTAATQHFMWDLAEGLPLLLDDGTTSYVYGPGGTPLEQIADQTPAPITLVGKGNAAVTANNMITVPIAGPVLANDQILVSVTEDGNDMVTAPGYTKVWMESTTNQLIPTATTLFRRTAAGGEASAIFTFAKAEPEATAVAVVYRGVDPANPTGPVDGPSFNATGNAAATTLQVGSVTATYPGEMLVLAQGAANFAGTGSWATPSNNMQEEAVQSNQGLAAGALADQPLPSAGATGSRTETFSIGTSLMGIMVALRPAQPVLYFHGDQLGSTKVMTDSSGVVRATFSFDSYGNVTSQSGTATSPLLFNGQYRDSESGLYYLRARYYDPVTALFLSRDPAVATTRSAYGYVRGNPLNSSDPGGMDTTGSGSIGLTPKCSTDEWFTAIELGSQAIVDYCGAAEKVDAAVSDTVNSIASYVQQQTTDPVNLALLLPWGEEIDIGAITVDEFISRFCRAGIRSAVPGEHVAQPVQQAITNPTVRKLLGKNEYRKDFAKGIRFW